MKELNRFAVKDSTTPEARDIEFGFMEPSRQVSKDADMIYAKVYADCVRKGLLTNAEASKHANERGGVFTEEEKAEYIQTLIEFANKDKELKTLKEKAATEEIKQEHVDSVEKELDVIKDRVIYFQNRQNAVFDFTAESKARDAVLLHYVLALVYKDNKPFFEGKDFDTRLKKYEDMASDLNDIVMKKAAWYATALFYGVKDYNEPVNTEDAPVTVQK